MSHKCSFPSAAWPVEIGPCAVLKCRKLTCMCNNIVYQCISLQSDIKSSADKRRYGISANSQKFVECE